MVSPSPSPSPPPPYTLEPDTQRSVSPSDPPTSTLQPPKPIPFPTSQSGSNSSLPFAPLPTSTPWLTIDPRTSSTQSLLPPPSTSSTDPRRKLLIIYIHGFLGNDQSFQHFPAHVHAYLAATLADTHVIHSKIYPRYKTYRTIDVARDNFSQWLQPHEGPNVDVVLVGHSMGGILAADVVLMPNTSPYGQHPFKHRILGHVSLDCPFLGLHPGIIVSGITSLFKPSPSSPKEQPSQDYLNTPDVASPSSSSLHLTASQNSQAPSIASSSSQAFSPPPTDHFFNQPFFNDAALKEQPFVQRMMHFANKYRSEGIVQSAARHFLSYLEFGGCLADPRGLEIRYIQLRALEDVDELQPFGPGKDPRGPQARVRFVNYYTMCTGRPKTPKGGTPKNEPTEESAGLRQLKSGEGSQSEFRDSTELKFAGQTHLDPNEESYSRDRSPSPRPSIEISDHDEIERSKTPERKSRTGKESTNPQDKRVSLASDLDNLSMHYVDPDPIIDDTINETTEEPQQSLSTDSLDLPPIPDAPTPPKLPDLTQYTDKDSRKQAERESKRLQKAYEQEVKNRNKALHERDKILEKRRKKAQKDADKLKKDEQKAKKDEQKAEQKEGKRYEKETKKEQQRLEKEKQKLEKDQQRREREEQRQKLAREQEVLVAAYEANKPRKLRQFCNLPDKVDGVRDRTWVEVFMPDVDEVGAHCGLFFPGPQYEQLVGDVGGRIVGWVQEDMTKRAILEMGAE